jgi:hypothetical protein
MQPGAAPERSPARGYPPNTGSNANTSEQLQKSLNISASLWTSDKNERRKSKLELLGPWYKCQISMKYVQ